MNRATLACIVATMCSASLLAAQGDGASMDLQVTVTNVRGLVEVRAAEDAPWQKAEPGMTLGVGAEFRTGPRSGVQFTIPPDQTITLDRLGRIKVLAAIEEASGKVRTDLGMQYGRTRYKIEAAGTEHASTIRTPASALTVRGTDVGMQQDFDNFAWTNEHCAFFRPVQFHEMRFCSPNDANSDFQSPGEARKDDDRVDPNGDGARDDDDDQQINDDPSGWFDFQFGDFGSYRELDGTGAFDHHRYDHYNGNYPPGGGMTTGP